MCILEKKAQRGAAVPGFVLVLWGYSASQSEKSLQCFACMPP
jgi:hypothetical protein